jgi:hypothetical protein
VSAIPFYSTPDSGDQARRRLLLLSYHFPPDGAVGARRWEKLAHYAAERGWGIDVVTRRDDPHEGPHSDGASPAELTRLKALPGGVRIYGVPLPILAVQRAEQSIWMALRGRRRARVNSVAGQIATAGATTQSPQTATPSAAGATPPSIARDDVRWSLFIPRGYLRAYWAWLDFAQIGLWGTHVARLALDIVRPNVHRVVVNSGPPHMTHDAGRRVAELTGLPFVMDMRDPWGQVERLPESLATPLWPRLAARYERRAVQRAALVVANTELARRTLQTVYPSRRDDIITVMNGSDDDPLPPSRRGGKFVIGHAGTVYLDRDPRPLFHAAACVVRELGLTPDQFGLEFIGELEAVGGFPILDVAQQEGIANYVQTGPPRPYAQAMEFMANATMLVSMSGSNAAAIPAKTFECIRFDAWLLALSAPGSATELLLRGTSADVVDPKDANRIAQVIRERYLQYASGVLPVRIGGDGGDNDHFSRRCQANVLLDAIQTRIA